MFLRCSHEAKPHSEVSSLQVVPGGLLRAAEALPSEVAFQFPGHAKIGENMLNISLSSPFARGAVCVCLAGLCGCHTLVRGTGNRNRCPQDLSF